MRVERLRALAGSGVGEGLGLALGDGLGVGKPVQQVKPSLTRTPSMFQPGALVLSSLAMRKRSLMLCPATVAPRSAIVSM